MNLLEALIAKIAPHACLACSTEGTLLCAACSGLLAAIQPRCFRCLQPSPDYLTCPACLSTSNLHSVGVATVYSDVAKSLVWKLKLAGAQSAATIMAKHMAVLGKNSAPNTLIVPVPTATSRVRQRGYDQAKLLARELSRQTGLPYGHCLARHGQAHQHGLDRQQRLTQLSTAFRVRRASLIKNRHVILVDDVTTTGATLEAAAAVLQQAGATRIEAVVFAQPSLK
jgi:ComF family protein